ncbi:hypothetical protein H2198_007279 [Neophaeococcomyces mojaviensis]|uniref:Uncharacterized protein n=1 Tax=Neophaeococcomyces mojaviensis TaxID=3383035 RepID=A0ACC3A148_9EURO|nr:hypothetical protein H2198_007279 [Knufia sp. JES_112]
MAESNQSRPDLRFQSAESTTPLSPSNDEVSSPTTRVPYRRQKSWVPPNTQYQHVAPEDQNTVEVEQEQNSTAYRGLGLSNVPQQSPNASSVKRVPVRANPALGTPTSPEIGTSAAPFSQTTTAQNTGEDGTAAEPWLTPSSSRYSVKEPAYQHSPSNVHLLSHDHGVEGCPTQGDLLKSQWNWFTTMIVLLAIFSTVFSGIFLGIALAKPRWGHRIGPRGALSYDTATLLSALFSKLVELSFATTCVVTLGQILTRRAFARNTFSKSGGGISIADMNMRLWIMQPGTLMTHWIGVKYAITSFLGISALIAAFATSFYTTACESLVSPKLKFGANETRNMFGEVSASYANALYLAKVCQTPITTDMDPTYAGSTCLQINYAGNGFRNLDTWMASWRSRQLSALSADALEVAPRPPPVAILYENTTIFGSWITPVGENITSDSIKHKRLLQNVTMVMPHANVFHATRNPKNRILQPEDLQGSGEYYVKAAVPAPALNVLCAGASEDELAPLMRANASVPPTAFPNITTVLDGIFDWTHNPKTEGGWYAPWFTRLPKEFNTIVNSSSSYGPSAVYLLSKPPNTTVTNDVVLCAIKSFQYTNCSTAYHVAQSGGQLSVHCDNDSEVWRPYRDTIENKTNIPPLAVGVKDWKDVGMEWINSVALSQGITDADASIARLVTQMIPSWDNVTGAKLSPSRPSIGEALSVLAGYTLLLSSNAAPFEHYWKYAPDLSPILDSPATENFSAILSYKDFASGGDQRWKGIFYIVLVAAFVQNCFCLGYLLWYFWRDGEVTDYTEPQNLFALAINSPPTQILAGACGGGPSGEMLGRKWCVDMSKPDPNTPGLGGHSHENAGGGPMHPHFFVHYQEPEPPRARTTARFSESFNLPMLSPSPGKRVSWSPSLLSKRRSRAPRPRSLHESGLEGLDESPAVTQYMNLVGR